MPGVTAFVYHDDYQKYQFGPNHPFQPIRERLTLDLLKSLGAFNGKAKLFEPRPAREEDLLLAHKEEYVSFVKRMSRLGLGYLEFPDTPVSLGIYDGAISVVGGTIYASDLVMRGEVAHAFNPGGGLHHAKPRTAAGFCVFNDIVIAVRHIQRDYGIKRIAILDIDGHHGDGTQLMLYREPILKIDFHRYGDFFYPGTGSVDEIGDDGGKGYTINIPLPFGTGDEAFLYAFDQVAVPLLRAFQPEIIIQQFGVDAHYGDPLVGLALTTKAYETIASKIHALSHELSDGRLVILGGGGYDPPSVARCWAIMFVTISEVEPQDRERYSKIFDAYQPEESPSSFEAVKATVKRIKEVIFPIHGIG
ncbi:acetoin utilization protein AcuC [Candidatus Bathyarchaeota archaeon]|nr:acetoin utilization protein AcuC [Candidatus Bathyarchaeota archaeon]